MMQDTQAGHTGARCRTHRRMRRIAVQHGYFGISNAENEQRNEDAHAAFGVELKLRE